MKQAVSDALAGGAMTLLLVVLSASAVIFVHTTAASDGWMAFVYGFGALAEVVLAVLVAWHIGSALRERSDQGG